MVANGEHGHGAGTLLEPVKEELDGDAVPGRAFVGTVDVGDDATGSVLGAEARAGIELVQPAINHTHQLVVRADGKQAEVERRGAGVQDEDPATARFPAIV